MNQREASRREYRLNDSSVVQPRATLEEINGGSFQRIADATEKMARNWDSLVEDRDRWKRWHDNEQARANRLQRTVNALRGVITRLRRLLG